MIWHRFVWACVVVGCGLAQAGEIQVSADFPGGSGVLLEIDQEKSVVKLNPTPHTDRGWVCWWYVKISGLKPQATCTLDIGDAPWATPDRATVSWDGKTWQQTAPGKRTGKRIAYEIPAEADSGWFAWGPPFVPSDAETLVQQTAARSPYAQAIELCRTVGDRPVPALRVSQPGVDDAQRWGLWVQARQHAWESGSSWVCRGFVEWITSDDPRATDLRKKSLITIVPIMDIDNVAIGAGGKNEKPQDHNRDWTDRPHWKSVAAAQQAILKLNETGRLDVFIDLHNTGANDLQPFYFCSPKEMLSELGRQNLDRFVEASRAEITGPLKLSDKVRESGANYDKSWEAISKNWVTRHCRDHVVSVTLETSWNTPHSTTAGYQQVGKELGLALEKYFRTSPRRPAE